MPLKHLPLLLAAALLSGCVSLGTFNAIKLKNDDLQSQLDEIHTEAKGLQSDLGTAKQANEALNASNSTLSKEKSELQQVKDSLEAKTAQLLSQTAQLKDAQAQLESQTAQLAGQNAALASEKNALEAQAKEQQAAHDALVDNLKKEVNDGQLKITQYKNMLTLDVADKILFDSGKAALKADGKAVLKKVGAALTKGDKVIRVVGHTDDVPLGTNAAYASNWELSTARATTVVRFLQDQAKLDPKRLIAEGRGEYSPVAPNDTPENRQKNRRIEITLIDRSLVDAVQMSSATPTAQP